MEAINGELPKNPFLLRKSVESCVGAKIDGAFPENKGTTYALKVRSSAQVKRLMNLTSLIDGTGIKIIEHPYLNASRCVVNCGDVLGLSDEAIMEGLTGQGVREFRRITKRVGDKRENTSTLILTFAGTITPPHVDFGWIRCKTRPYYPAPMQCFNCWSFGHTRQRCQQRSPTCGNCSQEHAVDAESHCEAESYCKRCDQYNHPLSSRKCPVYGRENAIQKTRVDQGISYPAAKRLHEQTSNHNSYASVTTASKDHQIAQLRSKVDNLQMELRNKDQHIVSLTSGNSSKKGTNENRDLTTKLLEKVDHLTNEMKKKDERIQALEKALQNGSRMDMVRKHGTIEDLVAKVADLESKLNKKQQATSGAEKKKKSKKQEQKQTQSTPMYDSDSSPLSPRQSSTEKTPKRIHSPVFSDGPSGQPKSKFHSTDDNPETNFSISDGDDNMSS